MAHYYDTDGNPRYTYLNDKGDELATDLRRARKENLLPSHSEIEKVVSDTTGLNLWILGQHLEWCYLNPREEGESMDDYFIRAKAGGDTVGREARDFGSLVHDEMEKWVHDNTYAINPDVLPFVEPHMQWFRENITQIIYTEKGMGCVELGVGGRIDLCAMHREHGRIILDFKTQNIKPNASGKKYPNYYPSWCRQLALYAELDKRREGLSVAPRIISLAIDSSEPGPLYVKVWTRDEQQWGLESELANIVAWQRQKKYKPNGCNLEIVGM